MDASQTKSASNLAGLLRHLARMSEPEAPQGGLTPVQWSALRYFAQANRYSRTVSGFASYNATTRGTASQTIKALEAAGYLDRTPRPEDGRSARIDLTDAGWTKLAEDPAEVLAKVIEALPDGSRESLEDNVERLLAGITAERGQNGFGTCPNCAHLEACPAAEGSEPGYYCCQAEEYLQPQEIDALCVTFAPRQGLKEEGKE